MHMKKCIVIFCWLSWQGLVSSELSRTSSFRNLEELASQHPELPRTRSFRNLGELASQYQSAPLPIPKVQPVAIDDSIASLRSGDEDEKPIDPRILQSLRIAQPQDQTIMPFGNPLQERPIEISIEQQVNDLYLRLLHDRDFSFEFHDLDLKNHKDYLNKYLLRKYLNQASDDLLQKLIERFSQPLNNFEILERSGVLYRHLPQKNLNDLDNLDDQQSRQDYIRSLIRPTYVIGKSLHRNSLNQIVSKMMEMYQRDRVMKIEKIAEDLAVKLFDNINAQKDPNENFREYQKRLKNEVDSNLENEQYPINVVLTAVEQESMRKKMVDNLIQREHLLMAEKIERYANNLYQKLMKDTEFASAKINLNNFLKHNPNYVFIKNQIFLSGVDLHKIIQEVEKKLQEKLIEATMRKMKEARPQHNKQ